MPHPTDTALVVRGGGGEDTLDETTAATEATAAWWWSAPDKDLAYSAAEPDVAIIPRGTDTYRVGLTARTLTRDLHVFPDRLHPEATVSDNGFTLLPGDTVAFTLSCPVAVDPAALAAAPVMQSVNRFGKAASRAPA